MQYETSFSFLYKEQQSIHCFKFDNIDDCCQFFESIKKDILEKARIAEVVKKLLATEIKYPVSNKTLYLVYLDKVKYISDTYCIPRSAAEFVVGEYRE